MLFIAWCCHVLQYFVILSLTAQLVLLVPKKEKMKTYKYPILVIAIAVGSEVIFKCLKHVYSVLCPNSGDTMKSVQTSCDAKRTVNKVIFFPDQGILSKLTANNTRCSRQDLITIDGESNNQHQDSYKKSHQSGPIPRPFSFHENGVPHSTYLKRSSSLIHVVNALDSARYSLKVCVYVITLQDMLDAIVRAKVSDC